MEKFTVLEQEEAIAQSQWLIPETDQTISVKATDITVGAESGFGENVIILGGATVASVGYQEAESKIELLESRVDALEKEVKKLKKREEEKVIVLRDISRDQVKREVLELFQRDKPLFYSDIAELLRLDLATVVEICEELIAEGEVMARGSRST